MAKRSAKTVEEVGEVLGGYDDTYLDCRDLHHAWRPLGYIREGGLVRRTLLCDHCSTERTDRWTARGERLATRYRYPEGYTVRGGGFSPLAVRVEVLNRVQIFSSEQDMLAALTAKDRRQVSHLRAV